MKLPLLFACLAFLGNAVFLHGQREILQIEGYVNYTDHRIYVINSSVTCDSLPIKTWEGKKYDPEQLVCFINKYGKEDDFIIYDREGISLNMDENGELYARDMMNNGKRIYLGINPLNKIDGKKNMAMEIDDYDYDSLSINFIPLEKYRIGESNRHKAIKVKVKYEDFIYKAKGILSPSAIDNIGKNLKILPEDGVAWDSIVFLIPVHLANVEGRFSIIIYDLKGNVLKMHTGITSSQFTFYRQNLTAGTYRYKLFFGNTTEITSGMFNFKEIARPE